MRPERADIAIPEFPHTIEWLNTPFVRASMLIGRKVPLVWFWDCASLNALRALPYVREWHRRYAGTGLHVVGVHSPQFDFGRDAGVVERAALTLDVPFDIALDRDFEIWQLYGNEVWPSLYLWDRRGLLRHYHFGEGEYAQSERAIQELLMEIEPEVELPEPMAPLRETDRPNALVRAPTPHQYMEEDRSPRVVEAGDELAVRYQAAVAAAVLDGAGEVEVKVDGGPSRRVRLEGPGLYTLVESPGHEEHELRLRFLDDARAYAFSFGPGPA